MYKRELKSATVVLLDTSVYIGYDGQDGGGSD